MKTLRGGHRAALAAAVLVLLAAAAAAYPQAPGASAAPVEPAACGSASSAFLRSVCAVGLSGSWRSATVSQAEIGPTAQMYARVARAFRSRDASVCDDPATTTFIEVGAKLDAGPAREMCLAALSEAATRGSFAIGDPATGNVIWVEVLP